VRVRDSLWVTTGADDPSDEELLVAVAEGSRTALRLLYDRHAPWLRLRLLRRCADPTIVHDTIQDTFVAVWRGAARYDASGSVPAWIWGIGVRRLIGQFRAQSRRSTFPVFENELASGTATDDLAVSAEELVLSGVEHGDLAGAINQLAPELRAVVQATVLDGLTTREASRLLGIPTGTVKTRMMRAKREMRAALT
jgi:RNA polymerase sigma-70 factor (ECF subfamily)